MKNLIQAAIFSPWIFEDHPHSPRVNLQEVLLSPYGRVREDPPEVLPHKLKRRNTKKTEEKEDQKEEGNTMRTCWHYFCLVFGMILTFSAGHDESHCVLMASIQNFRLVLLWLLVVWVNNVSKEKRAGCRIIALLVALSLMTGTLVLIVASMEIVDELRILCMLVGDGFVCTGMISMLNNSETQHQELPTTMTTMDKLSIDDEESQ